MGEAQTSGSMTRERDESGRIVESYPPDMVHEALADLGSATTTEVADDLGSSYETAYKKLRSLEDDGRVSSRKVGNARLWSANENGDE